MNADLSLYLVTDAGIAAAAGHDIVDVVRQATASGVTAVQLREKDASARQFLDTVTRVSAVLPDGVALLVNDRVDVFLAARQAGARVSGVHVGQSDLPPDTVRALIGDDAIIGLSAATPEQLAAASGSGVVDYVGIGALHATATKRDAPPPLGHESLARLVAASALPAVAIGGVTAADLGPLRRAGAAGAAVVSAVCGAGDPAVAVRMLRAAWDAA
ncbi:thiamine phosphate synthase [Microbacterium sp. SORGH_AS_0862]|uniref:thiamine phosphate synthase n=1 Tax=Microbacterium sp. SORGH_AS_0862 TaxID=3041789 RepID=UPI00278F350F|nr:thiamine phosphate synthase [Microbacterium sp. SORGH_AS_0862]MDQ1203847.1 thiamine-phosphate pyrophosphorylase [Microbacterium sp. SORGH_AS_0862]